MAIDNSKRLDRVKSHLFDYINANKLTPGDRLPSESELAKSFGVSRNTVREAYITLEAEGVIVRQHGIGTFVSQSPKIKEPILDRLFGFHHIVKAAGSQFNFKLCSIEHVVPDSEVNLALQQELDASVLQVKRILFADERPGSFIIDHFSAHVDKTKLDWEQFDGHMLEFISNSLGISERRIHTNIRAALANAEIANRLSVLEGTPIVNVCSTVSTMNGNPLTYSVIYLHPNNYELEISRIYKHQ